MDVGRKKKDVSAKRDVNDGETGPLTLNRFHEDGEPITTACGCREEPG
jgi:hypothetical protein